MAEMKEGLTKDDSQERQEIETLFHSHKSLEGTSAQPEILSMQKQRSLASRLTNWFRNRDKKSNLSDSEKFSQEKYTEYMRVLCPYTPYPIRQELRADIHWRDETKIKDIVRLAHGEGASDVCVRLRAPGGEIIPMKESWERAVESWMNSPSGYTIKDFVQLGKKLAKYSGATREAIKNASGVESTKHIFAYHYEALHNEGSHWHGHSCGAHGYDTHRAMMAVFAQAAMYAWATDGKKRVSVAGRRTQTDAADPAALLMPDNDLKTFVRAHFAHGNAPEDMNIVEQALIGTTSPYKGKNNGKDRPPLEKLHRAMVAMNTAFKDVEQEGKTAIISCADDRLGIVVNEDGSLTMSTLPEHASDTMYVSIGRRALFILNNRASAQRVYRSTIGAGVMDVNLNNMNDIETQLLHHVPLILARVMSDKLPTKHVYVDVVLGAEPEDPNHPATRAILKNKAVRTEALSAGIPLDKFDSLGPEEQATCVRRCIKLHEDLAFRRLKNILTEPLQKKLSEAHAKSGGDPSGLHLNLRIIRTADKERPTADIISYTTHSDSNGLMTWGETSPDRNGEELPK